MLLPRKTCWETGHLGSILGPRWNSGTGEIDFPLGGGDGLADTKTAADEEPQTLIVADADKLLAWAEVSLPCPTVWTI